MGLSFQTWHDLRRENKSDRISSVIRRETERGQVGPSSWKRTNSNEKSSLLFTIVVKHLWHAGSVIHNDLDSTQHSTNRKCAVVFRSNMKIFLLEIEVDLKKKQPHFFLQLHLARRSSVAAMITIADWSWWSQLLICTLCLLEAHSNGRLASWSSPPPFNFIARKSWSRLSPEANNLISRNPEDAVRDRRHALLTHYFTLRTQLDHHPRKRIFSKGSSQLICNSKTNQNFRKRVSVTLFDPETSLSRKILSALSSPYLL